jgi:hypothetical protein
MSHEKAISEWFQSRNPGTVTKQYRDKTPEMEVLETMMENPDFWEMHEDSDPQGDYYVYIPKEEYWDQLEDMGFTDPDFICASVDGDEISFEIR